MKTIKSLFILGIVAMPALASAQGYYGGGGYAQPAAGGFHNRTGRLAWGVGLELGGMHDDGSAITSCSNCDYNPLTLELDAHIGGMLGPRFALMAEFQVNGQTIHSSFVNGDTTLTQGAVMLAGQFWILPQLWIKGGIGFSHLQTDDAYFTQDLGSGGAIMGAAGFEVFSARNMAVDLEARIIEGTYNSGDDHLTSGTIGVGISWY